MAAKHFPGLAGSKRDSQMRWEEQSLPKCGALGTWTALSAGEDSCYLDLCVSPSLLFKRGKEWIKLWRVEVAVSKVTAT